MAETPIGVTFMPTQDNQTLGPQNAQVNGPGSDLSDVFKILSLHLPSVLGPSALSSSRLLQSRGSSGLPAGFNPTAAVFQALLSSMFGSPALQPPSAAPSPGPDPFTPPSYPTGGGTDPGGRADPRAPSPAPSPSPRQPAPNNPFGNPSPAPDPYKNAGYDPNAWDPRIIPGGGDPSAWDPGGFGTPSPPASPTPSWPATSDSWLGGSRGGRGSY